MLVPTRINFASSILIECTYILVGTFSCIKKLISGKRENVPGGRRDDTCDHGLSRRPLKTSYELSWKVKVINKKKKVVLFTPISRKDPPKKKNPQAYT